MRKRQTVLEMARAVIEREEVIEWAERIHEWPKPVYVAASPGTSLELRPEDVRDAEGLIAVRI